MREKQSNSRWKYGNTRYTLEQRKELEKFREGLGWHRGARINKHQQQRKAA